MNSPLSPTPSSDVLLELDRIGISFGGLRAVDDLSFQGRR